MTAVLAIALAAALCASLVLYRRVGLLWSALALMRAQQGRQAIAIQVLVRELVKLDAECKQLEARLGQRNGHAEVLS